MKERQRKRELRDQELFENRKRLPIDYCYYSTEDEESMSEYDVEDRELYPPTRATLASKGDPRAKSTPVNERPASFKLTNRNPKK